MPKLSKSRRASLAAVFGDVWFLRAAELDAMAAIAAGFLDGEIPTMEALRARIVAAGFFDDDDDDEDDGERPYQLVDGVAVIGLKGFLAPDPNWMMRLMGATSTRAFSAAVTAAADDPDVAAICLAIDSPGGRAVGCEEAAQAVRMAAQQKPCAAFAEGEMCSAAYMIGAAAGTVITSPSSQIGSIGTLTVHREDSRANRDYGRTYSVISAGKFKADANQYEPLSKQGRETVQELVDSFYQQFVGSVARSRSISPEMVEQNYGQGKTFLGEKAVRAGLADRVGSLDSTTAELARQASPQRPPAQPQPPGQQARIIDAETGGRGDAVSPPLPLSLSPLPLSSPGVQAMDPRIMQRLVALGLISASDTAATAQAVLRVWYQASRHTNPPASAEQILQDLAAVPDQASTLPGPAPAGSVPLAAAATQPLSSAAPPAVPAAAAQALSPSQATGLSHADTERIRAEERSRVENIRARGNLLGVDATAIDQAINAGTSIEQFLVHATEAGARREPPIQRLPAQQRDSLRATGSEHEAFHSRMIDMLSHRLLMESPGGETGPDGRPRAASNVPQRPARQMDYMSALDVARASLRLVTGRDPVGSATDIAQAALGDPETRLQVLGYSGSGGNYQTPGDFPNILSGLAARVLEATPPYQGTTFQEWAYRRPSVPDRRPTTLLRIGEFGEFPLHPDGDEFEESTTKEDYSWIQADEYADSFGLSPMMIEHDDLGAFTEALRDKQTAHDYTLNRLCINLLVGNVTLGDGYSLFDNTNHGNAPTAASYPTTTTLTAVRKALRKQKGVSGVRKLNYVLKRVLIPEDIETNTELTLAPTLQVVPITDATAMPFRGRVAWSVDPMLADFSTTAWYYFADPQIARAIVYAYQVGYESMRTTNWYNPKNHCRIWDFAGRFAAGVNNYRGVGYAAGQ